MAQGQSGNTAVADAPDTLPPDFFDKKNGSAAPDTLPSDFFEKKAAANAPKSGSLDEYLSTPHNASTSETNELQAKVQKENLTPRMRTAISSGAETMAPPTRFEKEHTPAPEDTGVWGRLKQYGTDLGHTLAGMGETLSGPVVTPGKIADIAGSYASRAVPNKGQEGLAGARSPAYNALATAAQAVGVDPTGMEASAEHGDPTGVLTHAAAQATPVAAAELSRVPAVRKAAGAVADTARAVPNIPDKVALALRNEEGVVHPAVTRTIGAIGGATGAGLGHLVGVPEAGAIAGYGIGTAAADRLIPNLPTDIPVKPGSTSGVLPSIDEFYANRAEDLAKRGKEQGTIDKVAEREQTAQEKALAKEGKAVPITQGPYYNQHIENLKAQVEAAKPKIVSPTEGEPRATGSEGRPATWTNEFVLDQAGKGNRDAIAQAVRRGLQLPENARYVMGDPDFPRAVLNPREVTLFSPEGIPIRNKANAQAEAQQGNIPTIARTPRGSIPNIGEAPSKGAALPFPGPMPETSTPIAAAPTVEPIAAPTEPAAMNIKPLENAKPILPAEPEPQEVKIKGITAEEPKTKAATRQKQEPVEKRFSQQAIIDAEGLLASEAGASIAGERPGRYYDESDPNDVHLMSRGAQTRGGNWRGVKSGRNMFPFLRENPDVNPAAIERALRNKDSAAYSRLIEKAIEFNRRTNPNPEDYAYNFIKAIGENPDAEPVEEPTTVQPEAQTTGTIPNIGEQQPAPTQPLGANDRSARIAAAAKRLEQGLQAKQGAIPNIGEGGSAFKVPANAPVAPQTPPAISEALQDTSWEYDGKNNLGLYTIKEPGTNIRVSLFERDLNPDFIRRKIAEKEKQFGTPTKGKGKPKETGGEEVPF